MSQPPRPLPAGCYDGRVVLITGGGTGLGLACAKRFASLGADVVITGRRAAVLEKAVEEIKAAGAKRAMGIPMDVRSPQSVAAGVDQVEQAFGRPPCVVLNNAAGNFVSPSERLSPNAWKAVIDIVLMGTINVTTDIGKRWIKRRAEGVSKPEEHQPQVVFMQVGASYVERGHPFIAPSSVAKGAVLRLTEALSTEWGRHNIRLWMISPGPIYTEGAFDRLDPTGQMMKKGQHLLPLQRMGTKDEYADFVAYGCSPYASWLSGANIHFDGGSMAAGGEFAGLRDVTPAQWAAMEKMIRRTNAKDKAKGRPAAGASKL